MCEDQTTSCRDEIVMTNNSTGKQVKKFKTTQISVFRSEEIPYIQKLFSKRRPSRRIKFPKTNPEI
jgi:hypothetical protein